MAGTKLWMRIVGALYVALAFGMTILRLPIRVEGPPGALDLAAAGDPMARFVVDTWFTYGVELGVIGSALLIASRLPDRARALIWTVIAIEAVRGIGIDIYKLARGYEVAPMVIWMLVHGVIIATGVRCLRQQERIPAHASVVPAS